ncbi:serine threonine phosphatase [Fusarium beomiforme]|uniref:Serine threonine phosphatase n=1 Tax=Fusarium beomiforme TaxID=44412 RepID=A0A9P5AEW9_9HYPO|nr:serine threonine phosphatase [Fusarium beomiforme]
MRVFSSSRDPLDSRLREVSDVKNAVIGVLQALNFRAMTYILASITSTTAIERIKELLKEFCIALDGLRNEITLLHKISNTIRRASKDTQNIKAATDFKIRDNEGNDIGPFLRQLFENYIRDRFPGTNDNIRERLASSMLLRWKRILYRRKRYGKAPIQRPTAVAKPVIRHPKLETVDRTAQEMPIKRRVVEASGRSAAQSATQTATTLSPENFKKASAPSVISVSRTVALSGNDELCFPPAPCAGLMKRYNKDKKEIEEEYFDSLPPLQMKPNSSTTANPFDALDAFDAFSEALKKLQAKRDGSLAKAWDRCIEAVGEVTCPYCFHVLPVNEVVDERKWKLHVKNDLDPYICLFEKCESPEALYTHSGTWIKHMTEHALRWRCTSKAHDEFLADTREAYIDHMRTSHANKFTEAQLGVLADRNSRTLGPVFKACPLCGIDSVDGRMEDHVVNHMRLLALKSLPPSQEDPDDLEGSEGNKDSLTTSQPQSRSTIKNDPENHTALAFQDPPDPTWLDKAFNSSEVLDNIDPDIVPDVPTAFAPWQPAADEWEFISSFQHQSDNLENDPVLKSFLAQTPHDTPNTLPNDELPRGMDPDCAICKAPGGMNCDCEAKSLSFGVRQAEAKVMAPLQEKIRHWTRSHSQDFVLSSFNQRLEELKESGNSQEQEGQQGSDSGFTGKGLTKENVNEAWRDSVQRYPEVLEYYFRLIELTLPAEADPRVKEPPLGKLQRELPRMQRPDMSSDLWARPKENILGEHYVDEKEESTTLSMSHKRTL